MSSNGHSIDPGAEIGHVHLRVSDLTRALAFYRNVLGFKEQGRIGNEAAFLAAGDYHHHVALNTWESAGGPRPARGSTGLHHFAIRYPTRAALAAAAKRVVAHSGGLREAFDHGACEAVYLEDPDGNGIELYWDRPFETWPRMADGRLALVELPLDVEALLAAAETDES
jgi:catechol 2,3-dioxygenase